ncbi:MAG: hypothetical protein L0Y56_06740, partial [Nitrospira sp.]|nr:hypothetical protein [Nitrospira sp.]
LAETEWETGVLHATWDGFTGSLPEGHLRTILYASGGKLFKISTLKSTSLTPSQVSSEAAPTGLCDAHAEFDFSDHNNAVYIYELPGSDNSCGGNDNIWKMVRVGMGSSDNPIIIKKVVETLYNDFTSSIVGFLAIDGTMLVRCDQNFKICNPISPFNTTVESLQYNPFVGVTVLQIDDKLYTYNVGQRVLSSSVHTLLTVTSASVLSEMDATHFYFADGASLLKLSLTGSSPASPLAQELSGSSIDELELTRNRVAYIVSSDSSTPQTQSLKTIGKNGETPRTIVTLPTTDFLTMRITSRDFVYYQQESTSVAVTEDGMKREVPGAEWIGFTYTSSFFLDKVLRVEGCDLVTFSCAGGTLKSVDGATNSGEIVLGNWLSDLANPPFFFGIGSDSLGVAFDEQGTRDIFYVKPGQTNSLVRVTQTQDISELPIF